MKLKKEIYRDKLYSCWIGKNIGGTMGTPYEGTHDYLDIGGFVTKQGEVLPNDDLDLQLIWLVACRVLGVRAVRARSLGEMWLSYITPHWGEYGICKANMKRGLLPPLSGDYDNPWKHSNGAWIRTEIWASLFPAAPAIAAKYAIEDASVDHGAGEGTAAAAFVAAMQSAAYAGGSIRDIIDTALVYVPQDSRVAKTVRFVIGCYEDGMGEKECRDAIVELNSDIGHGWFQAPSNIGFVILGLLYGEGDFKKSMIKAINCGDDTDCTAATLGATLGILYGGAGIPEDWRSYIGDSIKTISIAEGCVTDRRVRIPKTCTDLTDMVMNMAPIALADVNADVRICDDECEIPENIHEIFRSDKKTALAIAAMKPYSFKTDLLLATATVTFDRQNDISAGESIGLTVYIDNNYDAYGNGPMNLSFRWILPEGFTVSASPSIRLDHATSLTNHIAQYCAEITAGETVKSANRIVLEVEFEGRAEVGYIPIVLIGK